MSEDHIGRAVPGWQGIDSAPKDGTAILLWDRYEGLVIGWFERGRQFRDSDHFNDWSSGDECNEAGFKRVSGPTAWMPLPDPPEVTG